MPTILRLPIPRVANAAVTDEALTFYLADGRSISAPLAWFPRLVHGTPEERGDWRLIEGDDGQGVHWPGLDEDVSVANLFLGRPSGESQASFRRWLEARTARGT